MRTLNKPDKKCKHCNATYSGKFRSLFCSANCRIEHDKQKDMITNPPMIQPTL